MLILFNPQNHTGASTEALKTCRNKCPIGTVNQYLVAKIRISEEKAKFYWDFFEREYLRTKFRDRD